MLTLLQRQPITFQHVAVVIQAGFHGTELLLFCRIDSAYRTGTLEHLHHIGMGSLVFLATLRHPGIALLGASHSLDCGSLVGDFATDLLAFLQPQSVSSQHIAMPVQARLHRIELLPFGRADVAS
ncbi:hypothetical protein SAMN05660284_02560 [Formivibrio citricus]|uniref:Uncharacterized protein n=1 Tax=Formivibrio citricus TaxID=83765 RepID=A0A1I5D2C0_9NEIS|nr:hypothetical protein [Formivibrio citricus]SFN93372.1 hypothetical protein SAMN05660284_02560 [Formivibrio citricus]